MNDIKTKLKAKTPDSNQNAIDLAPSAEEVAKRAYFSYLNQGSPHGRDMEHWLRAEAELIAERNLARGYGFDDEKEFFAIEIVEASPMPVFPKTPHRLRQIQKDGATNAKSQKRNNNVSQSRDMREDRGRQMNTTRNSQTLSSR